MKLLPGPPESSLVRDAALVALFKAAVSAAVLATGFRAVSDDDFARVAIAQAWAHAPRLDPSGTSWLPLPFWTTGAAMAVLGRSLFVARALSFASGVAAAVVVLVAARWLGGGRREHRWPALAGALAAAALPWSARLGVATVPELPAAALVLLGMASLVPRVASLPAPGAPGAGDEGTGKTDANARLVGGAALLGACLCRYEAWPIAAGFAAYCLRDGLATTARASAAHLGAAALAVIGPASWIAWNAHAHGDAMHFAGRVAAYHGAVTGSAPGVVTAVVSYARALLQGEPELCAIGVATVVLASSARDEAPWKAARARLGRPVALAAALVLALVLAAARSGAPTHHAERALLPALLLAAVMTGGALFAIAERLRARGRLAFGAGVIAVAAAAGGAVRWRAPAEGFQPRHDEVAIGTAAAQLLEPPATVLVEVADYGYWAVIAATGRPESAVPDRSFDPRLPAQASSFTDEAALRARVDQAGATAVAGRPSPPTSFLGTPTHTAGGWALWRTTGR